VVVHLWINSDSYGVFSICGAWCSALKLINDSSLSFFVYIEFRDSCFCMAIIHHLIIRVVSTTSYYACVYGVALVGWNNLI